METVVMGKKVTNKYEVYIRKDDDGKYLEKPKLVHEAKVDSWEEICRYEGEPQAECKVGDFFKGYIHLSDNECVQIEDDFFRADLGVWHQRVDKVVEEKDVNLKKAEKEFDAELKLYNTQRIENDEKAKAYCDVHQLDYGETDYNKLRKILPRTTKSNCGVYIRPDYNDGIPW